MTKVKDYIKELEKLDQDSYLIIGVTNDKFGRFDKKAICIEKRLIGGDGNECYYSLCTENYETDGCLKFYR